MNWFSKSVYWSLVIPIIGFLCLVSIGFMLYIPAALVTNAEQGAIHTAQGIVKQYKNLRSYYTKNVVQKVLASGVLKTSSDHKNYPDRIPLPATMIHELSEKSEESGMNISLYSQYPFPNRVGRTLDDFQRNAWKALQQNPGQTFSVTEVQNGIPVVRVALADTMVAEACVSCHNSHPDTPKNDWRLGDIRGVLEVAIPIDTQVASGIALSREVIGILFVVLIAIVALLSIIFRKTIQNRLNEVVQAVDVIGNKNLTYQLDDRGNHEISRIAKGVNTLSSNLKSVISNVRHAADRVAVNAEELSASSEQTKFRLSEQQSETMQIATAVTQMNATLEEVSRNITDTAAQADMVYHEANQGSIEVAKTRSSIEILAADIDQATKVISRVQEDSDSIGSVVDVIRGISDQTNLLALNAAIEAARAGEQGRGFAVVADEVRTLAGRTQASTEEIRTMIEKLKIGVDEAVKMMAKGRQQTEDSVIQAEKAEKSLDSISDSVTTIKDMTHQIAVSTEEQNSVTQDIDSRVNSIAVVANETLDVSAESVTLSVELSNLSKSLSDTLCDFKIEMA